MPITTIHSDTTVEKLVTRVYGKLPAAKLRAITAATIAANPHVGESGALAAGTLVVVPPIESSSAKNPVRADVRLADDTARFVASALDAYRDATTEQFGERLARLDESQRLLTTDEFRRGVASVDDAAPLLARLDAAMKQERAELTESRERLEKDVAELQASLAKLTDRLG